VIGGQVHVEGDALAVEYDRAQARRAGGRTVRGEAVGATEARCHRRGRGESERVGVVPEVVVHEDDVVVARAASKAATSPGSIQGRSAMSTTAAAAPRDATSASARSTTVRERSLSAIAQNVSPPRGGERRHVVATRRDEHSVETARAEHVEHVLEEPLREEGAVFVAEHGRRRDLPCSEATSPERWPRPAASSRSLAENARISRERRRRSSRDRMIVEVPNTGIDGTVGSSPRSTTIAQMRPR
jgi:hypothetical protein